MVFLTGYKYSTSNESDNNNVEDAVFITNITKPQAESIYVNRTLTDIKVQCCNDENITNYMAKHIMYYDTEHNYLKIFPIDNNTLYSYVDYENSCVYVCHVADDINDLIITQYNKNNMSINLQDLYGLITLSHSMMITTYINKGYNLFYAD